MNNLNGEKDKLFQESMKLQVKKAKKRDLGSNVVRIDPKLMKRFEIKGGDSINLYGKKRSAAIAWPAFPEDCGLNIIRMTARLRKRTETFIDDTIVIRKEVLARSVTLAPVNIKMKPNPPFEEFVKRKLNNYVIKKDDFIEISIGISRGIEFKVINITPNEICIIRQETKLQICEGTIIREDLTFNVLLMGDPYSGKEELLRNYSLNHIPWSNTRFPLGIELFKKLIVHKGKTISIQLLNINIEKAIIRPYDRNLYDQIYRSSSGVIIIYNITNSKTLEYLFEWIQNIRENIQSVPILLVGNKIDLEESREVSKEEAAEITNRYNLSSFIEISSETGQNVNELFVSLIELITEN